MGSLKKRGAVDIMACLTNQQWHSGTISVSTAYGICPTRLAGGSGAQWLILSSATGDEVELGSRSFGAG